MRKICTTGHIELKNFFNEIGIGRENNENTHLVAPGNCGWLNGDVSNTYYYVDSEGRFECSEEYPSKKGYSIVPIPEFIEYHRERLNLKPKQGKMITVTKKELGKIYEVACTTWKARIQDLTLRNPFGTDIELSQAEIDEMFKAATKDQIPTLESIFGKQGINKDHHLVQTIINQLNDIEVDGETMQYILEKVGMEWQMLRQLMLTMPLEQVEYLIEERKDLKI